MSKAIPRIPARCAGSINNATCQKPTLFIETTTNNRMAACQLSDGSVFLAFMNGFMVSGSQPQSL